MSLKVDSRHNHHYRRHSNRGHEDTAAHLKGLSGFPFTAFENSRIQGRSQKSRPAALSTKYTTIFPQVLEQRAYIAGMPEAFTLFKST